MMNNDRDRQAQVKRDAEKGHDMGRRIWRRALDLGNNGRHIEALERYREAENSFLRCGRKLEALRVMRDSIQSMEMLGRYKEAIELAERCRVSLERLGGLRDNALLDVQEANIRHLIHDHHAAIHLYRRARRVLEAEGDQVMVSRIGISLGNILTYLGELKEAEAIYRRSRERLLEYGETLRVAITDSNLGLNLTFQGRYLEAIRVYRNAREIFTKLEAQDRVAMVDLNLSELYLELNLYEEADRSCRGALRNFKEMEQDYYYALACLNYYFVRRNVNRRGERGSSEEEELLKKAHEIFLEHGGEVWAAVAETHCASSLLERGMSREALNMATSASRRLKGKGVRTYAYYAQLIAGNVWEEMGNLEASRKLYREVVDYAEKSNLDGLKLRGLRCLGGLWKRQGLPEKAIGVFAEAIDTVEKVRTSLKLEDFRASFIGDKAAVYGDIIGLYLDKGMQDEALEYVERSKSSVLLDFLSEHIGIGMGVGFGTGNGDGHSRELTILREKLNSLYTRSRRSGSKPTGPEGDDRPDDLTRKIRKCERKYQRLLRNVAIERADDTTLGCVMNPRSSDPTEIAGRAGDDLVVLEYFDLEGELILFARKEGHLTVIRNLGRTDDIHTTLKEWREELMDIAYLDSEFVRENSRALMGPVLEILREWQSKLLEPAGSVIGGAGRLLVIPHQALHHLPFHAFFDGESFAIEKWEILYSPSLHVYDTCRKRKGKRVGEPLLVGVADEGMPFINEEIDHIRGIFPLAQILRDDEATVDALKELAGEASILHVGCHGMFRWDNPLFSFLQLSDGRLTAHDIYDLRLSCDLVVLSGCETGVSDVRPGDEVMGLCRAFLLAGTPSMILSLWAVNDRSTAKLMGAFYRYFKGGDGAARALRKAQLDMIKEYPHPFYWAPFVLNGRGS